MSTEVVEGIECCGCCSPRTRRAIWALYLGQIVSLCLCGTALTSSALASKGVSTPAAQSFLNYLLLGLVFGTWLAMREENGLVTAIGRRGWRYALLALVDVEANYLVVMAYQYTNLTSIQILDCFTIPVVLLLSWLTLHTRYLMSHIVGVAICLAGVASLIYADVLTEKDGASTGSHRLVGDLLILGGATLYGVSNVSTEFFVKNFSRVEYLGMIGLFGSIISGFQLAVFERTNLSTIDWADYTIMANYVGFALCMFVLYTLLTVVMDTGSATLYNLSILTADIYALVAGLYLFDYTFHWLYFVAFVLVLVGGGIYTCRPTHRTDELVMVDVDDDDAAVGEIVDAHARCAGGGSSRRSTCVCCNVPPDTPSEERTPPLRPNGVTRDYKTFVDPFVPDRRRVFRHMNIRGVPPPPPPRLCPVHGQYGGDVDESLPLTRL